MKLPSFCPLILQFLCVFPFLTLAKSTHGNSNLFRLYIGALFNNVTFSEVPINPGVEFHFILAFAIDYTGLVAPKPTNGDFNVFWDSDNLSPSQVCSIKSRHENVKVALSIGGDSVGGEFAYFDPVSEDTWVSNAVSSLTKIIQGYHLDGIDIDYEHFKANPATFAKCIGRVIQTLKEDGVIKFASIAPYADDQVQKHYLALWKDYKKHIDYVNFQFYAYANTTTVSKFLGYFNEQTFKYKGGKVLVSYVTDGNGGLSPEKGFFTACSRLKSKNQLYGIFVWCADASKANGFIYEEQSQKLLANSRSML